MHDPTDPVGRLSMFAEFEVDLVRARPQEAHLVELHRAGNHIIGELEELFPVNRSTI